MEGLQPTFDINGNNDGWGNGWGALIGGAVGGAVGSAWNGNRWQGNGCCSPCGCGGANGSTFLMDSLSALRSDVASIGRDNLMQTAALQAANCQGFSGAVAATERVGAQLAQGQSRTEAAVYAAALQGQLGAKDNTIATLNAAHNGEVQGLRNTYELKSSIDACCCTTNGNIREQGCETRAALAECCCKTQNALHAEGEATRALISQLDRERLLRESCAKDAEIAQLKAQSFNSALATATQQQVRNDVHGAMTTILGHLELKNTGTTTAAAA